MAITDDVDTLQGMSGSPVYLYEEETGYWLLVGVHVGSNEPVTYDKFNISCIFSIDIVTDLVSFCPSYNI